MRDFYDRYAEDLAASRRAPAPQPGQAGSIVSVSGQWLGLDLLASPGLYERAWPRLCGGYAAEAPGQETAASDTRYAARRVLRYRCYASSAATSSS